MKKWTIAGMLNYLQDQVLELPEECDIIDFRLEKNDDGTPKATVLVNNDTLEPMWSITHDYTVTKNDARYLHKYAHNVKYKNLQVVAYSDVLPKVPNFQLHSDSDAE